MRRSWLLLSLLVLPPTARGQARREELAGALAPTMRMTEKSFERYGRLYQRWQDDAALPRHGERNPERVLGKFGGRDALAAADVLFTAVYEKTGLGHGMLETLRAVDALQNGSALDVLGFETDQFFGDRLGAQVIPSGHDPKLRVRLRGVESLARGDNKVRVGLTVSDRIGQGPLRGWRAEGGVETRVQRGGEVRGWVGATRPWPEPHGRR
ncbi:MAG: hypothetical protein HY553_01545 [Elusimicrobia bacterium]|nr:hypothetical protein [Elusimicrobiota bacterium]